MFEIIKEAGRARLGVLKTPHGIVETPSYVVVATDGRVRALEPSDLPASGTQIVISNTYHLWRTLSEEGLATFPGLHSFMEWSGPIMTDSGGFQVFSLGFRRESGVGKILNKGGKQAENRISENLVRVTESGVYFADAGEEIYLDAELSIKIQEQLGADIVFAFDEPTSPVHDYEYTRRSLKRTHAWARRSLEAKESEQLIYGIVQGGTFKDLRTESAQFIASLPFDGFAIGGSFGSSFGAERHETFDALRWTCPLLPKGKPRHLLGVGKIEDVFEAVSLGIDTFDCVIPTREARHGSIWTKQGRYEVLRGRYRNDDSPLAEDCSCPTCSEREVKKAELYALFKNRNVEALRLATLHNVYFFNNLMREIREAIREERLAELKNDYR